jgi:hypothetical protein
MATAEFNKGDLISLADSDDPEMLKRISDRITGTGRWSIRHEMVFQDLRTGKFYVTQYSRGATEQQDETPFQYAKDTIVCHEVRPVEKMVTVYERTP